MAHCFFHPPRFAGSFYNTWYSTLASGSLDIPHLFLLHVLHANTHIRPCRPPPPTMHAGGDDRHSRAVCRGEFGIVVGGCAPNVRLGSRRYFAHPDARKGACMLPVAAGGGAGAWPRLLKKVELFRNPALDRASVIECDSREKQKTRDSPVHESSAVLLRCGSRVFFVLAMLPPTA